MTDDIAGTKDMRGLAATCVTKRAIWQKIVGLGEPVFPLRNATSAEEPRLFRGTAEASQCLRGERPRRVPLELVAA